MRVRAAVVKPMRMVVPWCRPNKVIGAKLHITGAVRKGARPSLACGIRIDGRDRGTSFLLRRQQHVGVRVGLVAKIGAGPPGWGHPRPRLLAVISGCWIFHRKRCAQALLAWLAKFRRRTNAGPFRRQSPPKSPPKRGRHLDHLERGVLGNLFILAAGA